MLQDLAALTPPLLVCVAFLVGVGVVVRRELAPRRQARRDAVRSGAVRSAAVRSGAVRSGTERSGAGRSLPGAPGAGSAAPREAETTPDRGDGSQT
jgi:hypothetical protein